MTEYDNCISWTTQFVYCPLGLRVDGYRGCLYKCAYCFANVFLSKMVGHNTTQYDSFTTPANTEVINEKFRLAGHEQETEDMEVQALSHMHPIHLGGTSDPYPIIEKQYRATLSIMDILANNNYPTIVSTKGIGILEDIYIKRLEQFPAVVQITITTLDEKISKVMEPNAPTPKERLNVVKQLSDMGFYTTVRCEPYYSELGFETYKDLFTQIANAGARHVSFAPLRAYSKQHNIFKEALGNKWLENYLSKSEGYMGYKRLKNEYIIDYSKKFIEIIHGLGMSAGGAADCDSLLGDSYCCCAPLDKIKGFENLSKYNLYYAAKLAKERGKVSYSDMEKEWRPKGEMWKKTQDSRCKTSPQWATPDTYFLHQWNRNKSSGMVLDDVEGIYHDGFDEKGNAIFKYGKKQTVGTLFD